MADPAARINELNAARARWMADPANMQYTNPQAYAAQQQPALVPTQQHLAAQQLQQANAAMQQAMSQPVNAAAMHSMTPAQQATFLQQQTAAGNGPPPPPSGAGAFGGLPSGGAAQAPQGSALDNFYRVNGITGGTHTNGNWFGSAAQQQQPALNRASDGGISPGGMPVGARQQDGQLYASTGVPVGMSAVRPQAGPGIASQIRPGMTLQGAGQMPQTMQAMPRPAYGPSNGSPDRDPGPQPMPQGYGREGDRPAPPMVYARATPPIMAPMPVQRPNMNPSMPAPAPAMRNQNTPMGGRDFMAAPAQQPNNPRDKIAMALMNQRNGGR